MKNTTKLGLLGTLFVLSMAGCAFAASAGQQSVTASYTSTYMPGTCMLSVANAGAPGVTATAVDLSSGSGTLYVENSGTPDTAGNPTMMSVSVAYQDNGAELASAGSTYGGWYLGSTWTSGMSTTWSVDGTNFYPLEALLTFNEGSAYGALSSSAGYMPIDFAVTAPATLPSGTYSQQIVVMATC